MIGDLGNTDSDKQLFSAIIEGDRNAFECLFQKYYTVLCDYSWTYLDGKGEAEDAVQDVFVYIWNNRKSIHMQDSVRGYLFSAVKHRVLNMLKHKAIERSHSRLLTEFWEDLSKSEYSEEEQLQLEQIRSILQNLPPQCRTVFMKSCLEGKKYREIAEELQISVNTVKYHILRAYREIREKVTVPENPAILFFVACATTFKKVVITVFFIFSPTLF